MALEQAWQALSKQIRTTIHCQNCREPAVNGSLIEVNGESKFWCIRCQHEKKRAEGFKMIQGGWQPAEDVSGGF